MAQELWDACDREGNPLGFDLVRGELPRNGVFHLVAEVYSITHDGRVLVTQRHPDKPWGECWEITGGSVLKGETPLMGAVRELREETGITLPEEAFHPVYRYVWEPPDGAPRYPTIYHCFLVFFDPEEQDIRLQEGETVDWWLVPYEKFPGFILKDWFVQGVRERFPAYRDRFDRLVREHMNER